MQIYVFPQLFPTSNIRIYVYICAYSRVKMFIFLIIVNTSPVFDLLLCLAKCCT